MLVRLLNKKLYIIFSAAFVRLFFYVRAFYLSGNFVSTMALWSFALRVFAGFCVMPSTQVFRITRFCQFLRNVGYLGVTLFNNFMEAADFGRFFYV